MDNFKNFHNSSNIAQNLLKNIVSLLNISSSCSNEIFLLVYNATNITDDCIYQIFMSKNRSRGLQLNSQSNLTNSLPIHYDRPFMPQWWVQLLWSLLFGIIVLLSVMGNSLLLWIILANKKMRTVTNVFLLNLSISDLASTIFNTAFNFVFMLNSHWPFGYLYCVFTNFMANLTIASSVFTITAISIERFAQKCLLKITFLYFLINII